MRQMRRYGHRHSNQPRRYSRHFIGEPAEEGRAKESVSVACIAPASSSDRKTRAGWPSRLASCTLTGVAIGGGFGSAVWRLCVLVAGVCDSADMFQQLSINGGICPHRNFSMIARDIPLTTLGATAETGGRGLSIARHMASLRRPARRYGAADVHVRQPIEFMNVVAGCPDSGGVSDALRDHHRRRAVPARAHLTGVTASSAPSRWSGSIASP